MKMDKKMKIYHSITIGIVLASIGIMLWCYPYSLRRFIEGVRDIVMSAGYYLAGLFHLDFPFELHFLSLPDAYYADYLPFDIEEIHRKLNALFDALFSKDSFLLYLHYIVVSANKWALIITSLLPLLLLKGKAKDLIVSRINNNYGQDTKPTKAFKKYVEAPFRRVKAVVSDYLLFLGSKKYYVKILIFVWLVNLNILSIVMWAITYYLYFVTAWNFLNLPIQIVRVFCDLLIMFNAGCLFLWLNIIAYIINAWRRERGYQILKHNEMKNRGFIKSLPLAVLIIGTMKSGKTYAMMDMVISDQIMKRGDALDTILKINIRYPNFPWILFEKDIGKAIKKHKIFNLYTCIPFVEAKRKRFDKKPCKKYIYDYDYETYGLYYNNGLVNEYIFEAMETYAKAYYVYTLASSLIISNFPIRDDSYLESYGNLPRWNDELFRCDEKRIEEHSRYSHILDYDLTRVMRKMVENGEINVLEFGIIADMEKGKERGNKVEYDKLKKNDDNANPTNDGADLYLKTNGHCSMIDYKSYLRQYGDEQRADSLNANEREPCKIIDIQEKSEVKLAMPCFMLGDMFYDFVFMPFYNTFGDYRVMRGDNTLLIYLMKNIMHKFFKHYENVYNTYGYEVWQFAIQRGTRDGEALLHDYYMSYKKGRRYRYLPDSLSGYYNNLLSKATYGIDDYPTYEGLRPTVDEYDKQHSYFVKKLQGSDLGS